MLLQISETLKVSFILNIEGANTGQHCLIGKSAHIQILQAYQMQPISGLLQVVLKKGQTTNPTLEKYSSKDCSISSLRCLSTGQIFPLHGVKLKSKRVKKQTRVPFWGLKMSKTWWCTLVGNIYITQGMRSPSEDPAGSLLCLFLSWTYLPRWCISQGLPAVTQTLSPPAGSNSSSNISQSSHW